MSARRFRSFDQSLERAAAALRRQLAREGRDPNPDEAAFLAGDGPPPAPAAPV